LKGSSTETWHIAVNSRVKHLPKFGLLMTALMRETAQPAQMHLPIEIIEVMAVQMGEDTDKTDDPFHLAFLEHLIECPNTMFKCQMRRIDWL
jgi:hypothetical protein